MATAVQNPPSRDELVKLIADMGISVRALLRKNVEPYEQLGLAEDKFTDDQLIDFMLQHPILINRPIVVTPLGTRLCRPSEVVHPTGVPRLELRAVSIVKELRGKGYGSMLVSEMLESNPSQSMMAKCYVKSSQMADMLKRRGFYLFDTSPKGTQMLFRDPKKKASHTRMHLKN